MSVIPEKTYIIVTPEGNSSWVNYVGDERRFQNGTKIATYKLEKVEQVKLAVSLKDITP